ncbi:hypothetical protein ACLOJK_008804 [Asimina triloba]
MDRRSTEFSVLHHLPKELPWRLTSSPSGSRSAADVRPPAASSDPASTHHTQILATNAQTLSDGTRAGDATIVRTNPLNQISAQPMQWLDPADASSGGLEQQRPSSNANPSKRAGHEQSSSLHPASTVHGAPISLMHILGFIFFSRRPDRDQRATHLTNSIWAEPIANEQQSSPKFAGQQT